ncbi:hypothetical protein ElyMa_005972500 [Elysia marginata]|uniref:Uncharacterized protein n=1 Tax=Elysia marginata TaxID=1093978 RepID=A0AAV4GCM8_9GAST|nr:hypothetical protein ElyMa_005972500 [Elysia marginata]
MSEPLASILENRKYFGASLYGQTSALSSATNRHFHCSTQRRPNSTFSAEFPLFPLLRHRPGSAFTFSTDKHFLSVPHFTSKLSSRMERRILHSPLINMKRCTGFVYPTNRHSFLSVPSKQKSLDSYWKHRNFYTSPYATMRNDFSRSIDIHEMSSINRKLDPIGYNPLNIKLNKTLEPPLNSAMSYTSIRHIPITPMSHSSNQCSFALKFRKPPSLTSTPLQTDAFILPERKSKSLFYETDIYTPAVSYIKKRSFSPAYPQLCCDVFCPENRPSLNTETPAFASQIIHSRERKNFTPDRSRPYPTVPFYAHRQTVLHNNPCLKDCVSESQNQEKHYLANACRVPYDHRAINCFKHKNTRSYSSVYPLKSSHAATKIGSSTPCPALSSEIELVE